LNAVLRTPDGRFEDLSDFGFAPNYLTVTDPRIGPLRMHYVDEGPTTAPPVLLLHGQPTWSYLYRHVIASLVARGHRVIAPDHIGFGRSDKPTARTDYTFQGHVDWMSAFVESLGLSNITLVAQDWGGPIGLSVLAGGPDRFDRVVATNTILHTSDPSLVGRLGWANHSQGDGRVVLQEALVDYVLLSQRAPALDASLFVGFATTTEVPPAALAAYDAPFPDESFKAGLRQFPVLIPLTKNDPGAAIGRATGEALARFDRPFLTAYSDADPASAGWDSVFQALVPGAAGQPHTTIAGAGHFVQEDRGDELARIVADFIEATPRR